jgi:phosphoglycolate phosphatase
MGIKQLLNQKKLLLFDIDDTLVDSCSAIIQHHIDTAKKMGLRVPTNAEIRELIGMPWDKFLPILWPELDLEGFKKVYRSFPKQLPIKLYPEAMETLNKLKQTHTLGIVTGRDENTTLNFIPSLGLDLSLFSVICNGNSEITKPDPDVFDYAIKQLNKSKGESFTSEDALFIGDSLVDCTCAKDAKMDFIGVLTGDMSKDDFNRFNVPFVDSVKDLV